MIHLRSESALFYCAAVSYLFSLIKIIYCNKKEKERKVPFKLKHMFVDQFTIGRSMQLDCVSHYIIN